MRILYALVVLFVSNPALGQEKQPFAVRKALERLEKEPDHSASNFTAGKYFAFVKGDFEKGIPYLAKGTDKVLKEASLKDLAGAEDSAGQLAIGDAWIKAGTKKRSYRKLVSPRVLHWYQKAWPRLRGKERENIRKVFRTVASPPRGFDKPVVGGQGTLEGWVPFIHINNMYLQSKFGHTGGRCAKLLPSIPGSNKQSGLNSTPVEVLPGTKYVLKFYAFSVEADKSLTVELRFYDQTDKAIIGSRVLVPKDSPFWKQYTVEGTSPENAFAVRFHSWAQFTTGAIFVDDVAVIEDKQNIFKGGSFE